METTESRYAHLLQPIRELYKNWDIDVASELNDYLEELDDMCITFDGGRTSMNFAEAALLIQGSTCIYSKKVELLHRLVYNTLEYINDKNQKRTKEAAASPEDGEDGAERRTQTKDPALFSAVELNASDSDTADHKTVVCVAPLPPDGLIPLDASEKDKLPLISVKGEVLFSQKDFRINLYVPGDEDMILFRMPSAASSFLLDSNQFTTDSLLPRDVSAPVAVAVAAEDGGGDAEDFCPLEDDPMEPDMDEHVERHQAPSEGRMLRERPPADAPKTRMEETPPAVSVWALHDPYSVLGEERPLKPGKCYRVPDGLDGGKRKRRGASSLQDFGSWFKGTFEPPEHKMKNGPSFTDLNYIYVSTMKEKLRSRKRINRRAGVVVSDEELRRTFLQPEEAGPHIQGEEPEDGFNPLLDGDEDLDLDGFPDDLPAQFVGGADLVSADGRREEDLSYEDLVKLRVEQLVGTCRGYVQETALSRLVQDWQAFLLPELGLQEQRPVFDIHDYGQRIVTALSAVGQRRSFASVVSGLDNFEACKYMLASLQLANDGTVEVDSAAGLEDSVDSMGLTLLSTLRATDRFKTMTSSS
ncbi:condensin-2 complex subunit H2 [Centropristis striata]|uniref:condensin-2 complex subunit H2 n=1 Tax=Centropristis striata TaxID=184440 RepID=UPI0027E17439|nr:condensin-2 complex subunit H2 [Centropristis striata]